MLRSVESALDLVVDRFGLGYIRRDAVHRADACMQSQQIQPLSLWMETMCGCASRAAVRAS